jgi:nucleotide-binding universal stress UspA family protein/predicted phosphoribosyltransferase
MRHGGGMALPRRILVPFDFTAPSKRACDYALELAAALEATLCLVHVVERFDIPLTAAERATLFTLAKQELERAASRLRPHAREVETLVIEGTPWREIEAAARDRRCDLIVMGTHGRRGIARALLGSVAGHVVRSSSVPVATLPEYVALSRKEAGTRLAQALGSLGHERPSVVALSRGALTVAVALADELNGTLDLWGVQPLLTQTGAVLGAVGEDDAVVFDADVTASVAERDTALAKARQDLRAELTALKGTRSIGGAWKRDVVLVADGLFSEAYARVALDAIRKLGARKIAIASPVASRDVVAKLEGALDAVAVLERATVADACVYRDDVLPADAVAFDLLLAPRIAQGEM